MKKLALLAAAALVTFAACSDTPTSSNNTAGTPKGDSYFPMTKGSTWSYNGKSSYTVTIMSDTTINGKSYTLANNSVGGLSLVRHDGISIYNATLTDPSNEILALKDGAPNGTAWSTTVRINGIDNFHEYTIMESGLTRTVNGTVYNNVIRVHLKAYMDVAGTPMVFSEGDYYYAKGVGLIESNFGAAGIYSLVSYSIK